MLLGLDHPVHALAEAGEACVLTTNGYTRHLSGGVLVGAEAALPSVADGGGAVQACVPLLTREAVGAGLEGRVAFVAGPDADAEVGRRCEEERSLLNVWVVGVKSSAFKADGVVELCQN